MPENNDGIRIPRWKYYWQWAKAGFPKRRKTTKAFTSKGRKNK